MNDFKKLYLYNKSLSFLKEKEMCFFFLKSKSSLTSVKEFKLILQEKHLELDFITVPSSFINSIFKDDFFEHGRNFLTNSILLVTFVNKISDKELVDFLLKLQSNSQLQFPLLGFKFQNKFYFNYSFLKNTGVKSLGGLSIKYFLFVLLLKLKIQLNQPK